VYFYVLEVDMACTHLTHHPQQTGTFFFTAFNVGAVYQCAQPASPVAVWTKVASTASYQDPCMLLDNDRVYMCVRSGRLRILTLPV